MCVVCVHVCAKFCARLYVCTCLCENNACESVRMLLMYVYKNLHAFELFLLCWESEFVLKYDEKMLLQRGESGK